VIARGKSSSGTIVNRSITDASIDSAGTVWLANNWNSLEAAAGENPSRPSSTCETAKACPTPAPILTGAWIAQRTPAGVGQPLTLAAPSDGAAPEQGNCEVTLYSFVEPLSSPNTMTFATPGLTGHATIVNPSATAIFCSPFTL
jgi:hypothetical protein